MSTDNAHGRSNPHPGLDTLQEAELAQRTSSSTASAPAARGMLPRQTPPSGQVLEVGAAED